MKKLLALIALASIAAPLMAAEEGSSSSSSGGVSSFAAQKENRLQMIDMLGARIAAAKADLNIAKRTKNRDSIEEATARIKGFEKKVDDVKADLATLEKEEADAKALEKVEDAKAKLAARKAARETKIEEWLEKVTNPTEAEEKTLKAAGALDAQLAVLSEEKDESPEVVLKKLSPLVAQISVLTDGATVRVKHELVILKSLIIGLQAILPDLIKSKQEEAAAAKRLQNVVRKHIATKKAAEAAEAGEEAPAVVSKKAAAGPSSLLTPAEKERFESLSEKVRKGIALTPNQQKTLADLKAKSGK